MKIAIIGLEHLGIVTAGCVAYHHAVTMWDSRPEILEKLRAGEKTWPHEEPGLGGGAVQKLADHNLARSLPEAVEGSEIVWVTYDTPVNELNRADFGWVFDRIEEIVPHLASGQILLISSQVRCGFTRMVQRRLRERRPEVDVNVYYSPENIRRGRGLETFCHQKRVVVGVPGKHSGPVATLEELFRPFCEIVEWMSSEAAEMSKHVLNAFLAVSIAFANEVGTLCGMYDVDPRDIERSLLSEGRINPGLPLRYGEAYSGGTLSRDVATLVALAQEQDRYFPLLQIINPSNDLHKIRRELSEVRRPAGPVQQVEEVATGAD